LPKKQGMVVGHKGKLHMLQGDIFVETRYQAPWNSIHNTTHTETMLHSVFAFATLPAQFALFMSPF